MQVTIRHVLQYHQGSTVLVYVMATYSCIVSVLCRLIRRELLKRLMLRGKGQSINRLYTMQKLTGIKQKLSCTQTSFNYTVEPRLFGHLGRPDN